MKFRADGEEENVQEYLSLMWDLDQSVIACSIWDTDCQRAAGGTTSGW